MLGETFNQVAYLAIGFLMYLARQSVAISAVTILQEDIEDVYRGRVFAFYDMLYNAAYVAGAALFAVFMAPDGKSPGVVAVAAAGFLVAASPTGCRPEARSPSAEAQRSSS